ncbi:MAG TPA: EAL domain-containing protein [Chloroflexota bacterium]
MSAPLAILLVEDSERDAELATLALIEGGYEPTIHRVDTAQDLMTALDRQAWDIIIADYSMPQFSGLAALEFVRQRGLDIPFILSSGTVGEDIAVEAMKAGAHDYVMKDNLARLVPAVKRELREADHRRQRRRAEAALQESERRFRAMFDQAAVGVAQSDLDGRWLVVNQRLLDLYGYSWEELSCLHFNDITHPDDVDADLRQFDRLRAGEISSYAMEKRFVRKDGSVVWANLTVSLVRDDEGAPQYTMAVVEDISERKRGEALLRHQALHDALTDLPNRTLLLDRLEQATRRARRCHICVALLLLDLDRFKEINDTFGHQVGDRLLQELGARLQLLVRLSDTVARPGGETEIDVAVARLGGDEFAILLSEADAFGAARVAERLIADLSRPYVVDDQALDIGASIGIALYPEHGHSAELLLQHADVAMYEAKRAHAGFSLYDASHDPYTRGRIALIADLRRAIERNELLLYVQPKTDIQSGRVIGAEALVRWQHPTEGFIPPMQIVELAEHTGLMKPLTLWVLATALEHCRDWRAAGLDIPVAVNLSARSLHDHQLVQVVGESLLASELPPSSLLLEITETAVMIDPERASTIIGQLDAIGVKISIDDFGTGYSSLSYLKELPAAELKIDKSFVLELDLTTEDEPIVRAAITLAHDFGMRAVAEGIESEATWERLRHLGCDAGQGYYIARPMPAAAFMEWVEAAHCESPGGRRASAW